jgi:hypothetical protein
MEQSDPLSRPEAPQTFDDIKTNEIADEDFRIYSEETSLPRVVDHYRDMRKYHTVEFLSEDGEKVLL